MSLLLDIIGGGLQGLGEGMVALDRQEQDYLAEKRRLAEAERQYQRNRKDKIADEKRTLGRQEERSSFDPATGKVTTWYKDGRQEVRDATPQEIREYQQEQQDREGKARYQEAIINQMSRSGSSSGTSDKPVTITSDSLLARMGFQSKQDLYDSGDPDSISRYESLVGAKIPGSEWEDIANRLQLIAQRGRQADSVLSAEQQGGLYFYEGAPGQLTPQEISARERQRLAAEKARRDRIERERQNRSPL